MVGLSGLFDLLGLPVWVFLAVLLVLLVLLVLVTAGFATRELAACDVRFPGDLPLRFCVPSLSARLGAYPESVCMVWLRWGAEIYHDVATGLRSACRVFGVDTRVWVGASQLGKVKKRQLDNL